MAVLNNTFPPGGFTPNEWMTTAEAAEYVKVKPGTLEKWRYLNKEPRYYKIGGKSIRYRRSDLDVFIEGGRRG